MSTYLLSYVNVWRQAACCSDGSGAPVVNASRDVLLNLWINLVYSPSSASAAVAYPLPLGMTYLGRLQSGYAASTPILLEADNSSWNSAYDRPDVNPVAGKLCVSLDLSGEALQTDLGILPSKIYHLNAFLMTGDHQGFLGQVPILLKNISVEPTTAEYSSSSSSTP